MKSLSVIFLAGGHGSRMKSDLPKQYHLLQGKPVFCYSFDLLKKLANGRAEMIVVADPLFHPYFENETVIFADPGLRRQDSVRNGLSKATGEWILVHDAARPFINLTDIEKLLAEAEETGAATLARPLKFTVKEADDQLRVIKTLNREALWEIQTPQVVKRTILEKGFEKAERENLLVTDDVSLAELVGAPVKLVRGSDGNLKITTPEDFALSEFMMQFRVDNV